MKQSPHCILLKPALTSNVAVKSKVWMRMNCFIWLWPGCVQMRITLCDEIQYFDITSLLFDFSSSIPRHLRRVLSLTTSGGRREKVQVVNCCDIFEVEAVILLMLLMARQICQCSIFGSEVVISKIITYANLICSNDHTPSCMMVGSQTIHTVHERTDLMVPLWVSATISHRNYCCKSHKKKQLCDTLQYENNSVIRDLTILFFFTNLQPESELHGGLTTERRSHSAPQEHVNSNCRRASAF